MSIKNYMFFHNSDCEYYPCHNDICGPFNCLFCFCPLYSIKDCGGEYELINNNIKDCSKCIIPHQMDSYFIIGKILDKYYKGEIK